MTNLNMDFDKRVVIAPEDMHWVESRLAGVERKMLEREGAEAGRATTIVRYAPGSAFSSHRH
ncbi:MAG: cupin, partial [Rhodospirillaceae bacterium]|nr:cupin [Rhodospirillaceae bacterium]